MADFKISLAAARVNANLTQTDAAEKIGASKSSIVKWESGKTPIKFETLIELADLYGVPVDCIRIPTKSTLRGES